MFSKKKYKNIQLIKPPSTERRNGWQAQYFSNADKPPIKTGHVPHALSFEFQTAFRLPKLIRNNK
jgi:hypothetical protein